MRRVAVVVFPGSNCDVDTIAAARDAGSDAYPVWHRDTDLRQPDVVILPGGFSYGDYLRSGAIARFSPAMTAVKAHAQAGGAVLGICNGFQTLCEAGLLPGALMRNARLRFLSRPVWVRVEAVDTPFTNLYEEGDVLEVPIAQGPSGLALRPRQSQWIDQRNRRHLQCRPQRGRHHATPGAPYGPGSRRR
jgi:phosphoribosylformylglycinamidine synthase